jgi:hypothetical protein
MMVDHDGYAEVEDGRPDVLPPHILARASLVYLAKEETFRIGGTLAFFYFGLTGLVSLLQSHVSPIVFYMLCIAFAIAYYTFFYVVAHYARKTVRKFAPASWFKAVRAWHDRLLTVAYTIPATTAVDDENPPIGRIITTTTTTTTPVQPQVEQQNEGWNNRAAGLKLSLQAATATPSCMIQNNNNNYRGSTTVTMPASYKYNGGVGGGRNTNNLVRPAGV